MFIRWFKLSARCKPVAAKSGGSDDDDRMDNMIVNIGMEYYLGSRDQHPPPEVQNFYRL
jgi:hypothetical protein